MKKLTNNKGFTLIELVVVMIILAILAAIIIPQLSNFSDTAEKSACQANQRILDSTTAMWRAQDIKARSTAVPAIGNPTFDSMLATDVFCPAGGNYTILSSGSGLWTCDATGHARATT